MGKVPKVECPHYKSGLEDFCYHRENDTVIVGATKCGVGVSYDRASRLPWALDMRFAERPAGRVINPTIKRGIVVHGADGEAVRRGGEHRETSTTLRGETLRVLRNSVLF